MKTAKDIVDEINALGLSSPHEVECETGMDGVLKVTEQDQSQHRWYVVGTVVFSVGQEYFGVRGPIVLMSEDMEWEDAGWRCEAFEMVPVPSVKYLRKPTRAQED